MGAQNAAAANTINHIYCQNITFSLNWQLCWVLNWGYPLITGHQNVLPRSLIQYLIYLLIF